MQSNDDKPFELTAEYRLALAQLASEGNPRAVIVMDLFKLEEIRGMRMNATNPTEWARNIHFNIWGETSFGGVLKARVIINRIKKGVDNG